MRINHNIAALNTHRQMGQVSNLASKSMERLSSGMRINRASDDAAGLAISEKMRGQIRGLEMAQKNSQDSISLLQTAEGALNETHSILQRMRELAVQSANDTNTAGDREKLQAEMDQLAEEITRISDNTEFNGAKLLDGSYSGKTFHIGANKDQNISIGIDAMDSDALGVGTAYTVNATANGTLTSVVSGGATLTYQAASTTYAVSGYYDGATLAFDTDAAFTGADAGKGVAGIDISSQTNANTAIEAINTAIESVSAERSKLGAVQNRLEHAINNLGTTAENLTAAESRIRDVDMAKEMMEFTKNNILSQAAQAMMAQANQQPQGVLQLLR